MSAFDLGCRLADKGDDFDGVPVWMQARRWYQEDKQREELKRRWEKSLK